MKEPFPKTALRHVLLALPVFLVERVLSTLLGPVLDNRLVLAALVAPLGFSCWLLWRRFLQKDRSVLLGGRFLAFFLVFGLLFGLLTATPVRKFIVPQSDGRASEGGLSALMPSILIDWRYDLADGWLADSAAAGVTEPEVLLITLPLAGVTRDKLRNDLAFIIHQARRRQAKGVALDFYFDPKTTADGQFCRELRLSAAEGFPVVAGFRYERSESSPIDACLNEEQRGHAGVIQDLDGEVRSLPLYMDSARRRAALSLRISEVLSAGAPARTPRDGVLRYLRPEGGLNFLEGRPGAQELKRLEGAYVLVGSDHAGDVHATPYGRQAGALIQAWSAISLSRGRFLSRLHPGWSFPAIFVFSYLLTAILARRGGWRQLVALAVALSAAWILVSVLATRLGGLWVDLGAPLAAIWLLVGLLLAGNGVLRGKVARAPARRSAAAVDVNEDDERPFDVFLSHNGEDKPAVRELAQALEKRGLKPWLDENELVPGQPWQEALEKSIVETASAVVLVGPDGLGPWETLEMRASLSLFVESRKPVIPVLLPGCGDQPNLPLFLTQFTWVDLRRGLSPQGLDRLEWGITGRKPETTERAAA